jgi:hypothetical protein
LGQASGAGNTVGSYNSYIGRASGYNNSTGNMNTIIGFSAGWSATNASGNVLIGHKAGYNELGSNKLYIANSDTINPLIKGDFLTKQLILNGKVGIKTSTFPVTVGAANIDSYQLFVKGGILTEEIRVRTGWADYVFQDGYKLRPLNELESYIQTNGHLPNVPSSNQVETDGLELGDIARIQQEKIEELTLYIIEQNKKIDAQGKEIENIKDMLVRKQLRHQQE